MKVLITNSQLSEGIIITDEVLRNNFGDRVEVPVKIDILEFSFEDDAHQLIEIGTTSFTPTVKTNVKSLVFDASAKTLDVLDANEDSVLSVSTNNRTVLARVNFATSTITIYE